MELNPIGALTMFKTMDMAPNFSEIAQAFGRAYDARGRRRNS